MIDDHYILDERRRAVAVHSIIQWAAWFETASKDGSRIVGRWDHEGVEVSTVFLGIDHAYDGGPPLLFETMIFGGPQDQWCERWSTWEQAEAGHMETLKRLREQARGR